MKIRVIRFLWLSRSPRRIFSMVLVGAAVAGASTSIRAQADGARRLNVILIITDDAAYGDFGCQARNAP